jgi:NADH dehydrogenase
LELAGALGEMAHTTLKNDFQHINPGESQILLLEGMERVLTPYPADLSAKAENSLSDLGVTVRTDTRVTDIQDGRVTVQIGDQTEQIETQTVVWAAGIKGSSMGQVLADSTGVELDRVGRVMVEPDLSVKGHPNILVIGDLAHFAHQTGQPLPGVAPVAMQQGKYAAQLIRQRLKGKVPSAFHYFDKGSLAVIGRNAAVAQMGALHFSGFVAWLAWVFVHIWYLIEFDNKLVVMFQWAWNYFTRQRGVRLITGDDPVPPVAGVPAALVDAPDNEPPYGTGETDETQTHQTRSGSRVGVGLSPAASR